jgi:DUF4097 and DUF4098 domain-containing protein YvlB
MIGKTFVLAAASVAAMAGACPAQQQVDRRLATGAGGAVEISNVSGSVRVTAWDRNEVQVTGTLGRGTERLDFANEGGRVVVRVVLPRSGHDIRGSDLEVRVPAGKDVTVRTVSADAGVAGVNGLVDARSVSGDLRVTGRPREVIANTKSGDVSVTVSSDRVHAESVSGDVEVHGAARRGLEVNSVSGDVASDAATSDARVGTVSGEVSVAGVTGRLEVSTVSGEIHAEGRRLQGSFQSVSGDVRIEGDLDPSGAMQINTHSGDVSLALPSGASAEIDMSSFSGDVETGGSGARITRSSGRERHVSVGSGGARVTVRTFSGDLVLSR